jgi:hypothetical protein
MTSPYISMVKDVVLLSIIGVLIFIPYKVERIGVIAAITSCKNNDGVQSIKRVIGNNKYTVVCRNTATFSRMTAEYVGEQEDDYELIRKPNGN